LPRISSLAHPPAKPTGAEHEPNGIAKHCVRAAAKALETAPRIEPAGSSADMLYALGLHQFFLWQVVLASVWLFVIGRKQGRLAGAMLQIAGDDADAVRFAAECTRRTSRYYGYSSFVYVIVFALTYMWLYNR
jgi:hypothetical protein